MKLVVCFRSDSVLACVFAVCGTVESTVVVEAAFLHQFGRQYRRGE